MIDVDASAVDVHVVRELVSAAATDERSDDEAVALLRSALEMWDGDVPLAGARGNSIEGIRKLLADERTGAVEDLMERELARGKHREVAPELTAYADAYPASERLQHSLVTALYRADRRQEALARLAALSRQWTEAMGQDLAPKLATVHASVLHDDPALAAPEPQVKVCPHQLPTAPRSFGGRRESP
jgi:DNA-binding SARP family transcriptional activator